QNPVRLALGTAPVALVTGDFDGDGHLDLATADLLTSDVAVLLGNGDGTFRNPVRWAVGIAPLGLAAGDFNRDGRADLALTNFSSSPRLLISLDASGGQTPTFTSPTDPAAGPSAVTLLAGRGDGTFGPPVTLPEFGYPSALVLADLTGDGAADLTIAAP